MKFKYPSKRQKIDMKNQKLKALLLFLTKECGLNKFSVIEKKDILASFDKHIYVDENELEGLVLTLERQGFIKIKYDDDNVFCLSVLREIEKETKKEREQKSLLPFFLLCLLGSFIGSLIATLISRLIS